MREYGTLRIEFLHVLSFLLSVKEISLGGTGRIWPFPCLERFHILASLHRIYRYQCNAVCEYFMHNNTIIWYLYNDVFYSVTNFTVRYFFLLTLFF